MSSLSDVSADAVISIHLWWRATEHGRRLSVQRQSWWYMLRTADGVCQDYPLPDSFKADCECMADAVVLLAELHGHFIDRTAVRNNWPQQSAVWVKGS